MVVIKQPNLIFRNALTPLNPELVKYIVLHHIEAVNASVEQVHQWHLDRKDSQGKYWAGIGYNEYHRKDGTVYICRGFNVGSHCLGYNHVSYGIAFEGDCNKEKLTPEQIRSGRERIEFLKGNFKNAIPVKHNELIATECPGKYFDIIPLLARDGETVFKDNLAVLVEQGIIKSPDYWMQTAQAGKYPDGGFVRALIKNMSEYVKRQQLAR